MRKKPDIMATPLDNLRVLFCSPALSFQADSPYSTRFRARGMAAAGLDVTVFGLHEAFPLVEPNLGLPYRSLAGMVKPTTARRLTWWHSHGGNVFRFLVEPLLMMIGAARFAVRERMDICFIADAEPCVATAFLLWARVVRLGIPLACYIPMNYGNWPATKGNTLRTRLRNLINYRLSRYLPRFMHVIATSRQVLTELGMSGMARTCVVPEGHEDLSGIRSKTSARAALELPLEPRMVLLFGVASHVKGADLLFKALEQVPPEFLVCVVGKTGDVYLPSWGDTSRLSRNGWGDRIRQVSRFVSATEMQDYYAACDAVVIPYRQGFAGTSGTLRTASEYGKAIIACDQHFIGERVRQWQLGLTFRTEDVQSMAAALRKFAAKPDSWFTEIAERSRSLVKVESWEAGGRMYRQLFEDMVIQKKTC